MQPNLLRATSVALTTSIALLALGVLPSGLRAAEGNTEAGELIELSEFTVSGEGADRYRAAEAISAVRVRAPLIDTASSISVVTRDMIEDLAPTRVFDVTRYIAGIQEGRGIQFQDRMIIRGFESNGQRTVDNFLQPSDADNIDEVLIDRIEVTKGPNAILSPAGAPGGSINIVTKSPLYQTRRSVTALLGLYDAQKLSWDLAGPFSEGSKLAYRVVGSLQDTRRYWSDDARMRGRVLAPMLSYRISPRTQLTVKLVAAEHWIFREPLLILDADVDAGTDKPYLAPGISAKGLNGIQPWSHVGTHTADLFVLLTTKLGDNLSLRVAANGRYYYEDSTQEFLSTPSLNNRYNPSTGELTQDFTWARNPATGEYVSTFSPFFNPSAIPVRGDRQATRRKTGNFQSDLVFNKTINEISLQTVGGIALTRQTGYGRGHLGILPPIDLNNADARVVPEWQESSFLFYNTSAFTNWQAYVNQRFGFLNDSLLVTGGILHYDTKTSGRNVLAGTPASILDDSKEMWMASVLYKVRDNISVYYSHSTNASATIANNVPLWREGVQDEIGFKTEFFERKLSFNGAYFEIDQTNVTTPNPARQTDPTAPEQIVADFGNHGFELELVGRLTPQLSVIATYSDLKMRDALGRRVRGVADHNAAFLVNYRFGDGALDGLALNFGVNYSGRRAGDVPINFTPLGVVGKTSFFLEPHYGTTFGATYRWKDRYLFRLHVDNVFDDEGYILVAGGRVSGTGITTAPGTNVKLSTTVEF